MTVKTVAVSVLIVVCSWAVVPVQADIITTGSWYLDQSNELVDGVNYGQVWVTANATTGVVEFVVDAFVEPYGAIGSNFGLQAFGFSYQYITSDPEEWVFTLPDGKWKPDFDGGVIGGFGLFMVTENGTGNTRQDPLVFSITLPVPEEAVASNFAVLSALPSGKKGGDDHDLVFFAAHVAGFGSTDGDSSHWIGGLTPVALIPVPAAVGLAVFGIGLVGWMKRRLA